MKKITHLTLFLIICNWSFAQTTLNPGDIAITGFNADNDDEFSFLLLRDIESGTAINFTDNGWQSSGNFRPGNLEGILTWVADTDLPCGTEINILSNEATVEDTYITSIGTITESEDGFALATNGDHILAYQGPATSPSFIFGIHFASNSSWTNATNSNTSAVPAGLIDGTTAVYVGNFDNSNYNCSVTADKSLILASITTPSNWNGSNSRISPLGGCPFCPNTSTWDGSNWSNGIPDLTTQAIIDGNYNTISNGSFSACALIVNSGSTLTVDNQTFVEVENDVTVNGSLAIQTQANFVQNDNDGIFTNNGTSTVTKTTPVKADWFFYTYWSAPVESQNIGALFFDVDSDRRFFFNANNYLDTDGDGIDDDNNDWQFALGTNTMTPGVGYAMTSSRQGNYPSARTRVFSGTFNTGTIPTPIAFNASNVNESWNFIGNPYPSALDFDVFLAANSTLIDGAAYFWSQATPPSNTNPGNRTSNFSQNDYATYASGIGSGTAGASGVIPTQFIPSGQGFFVAGLTNGTATFTNAMRSATETSNTLFFKREDTQKKDNSNKLWLNLTTENGIFSQILVGYVNGASAANDGLAFDAPRLVNLSIPAALYMTLQGENRKYAIQGKAINDLDSNETINLGFSSSLDNTVNYTLSIAQFEGAFFNTNSVFVKDNLLGTTHNLSAQDYRFTSQPGEFNDRFQIVFNENTFSIEALNRSETIDVFQINKNHFKFTSTTSAIKSITVYDLLGKVINRYESNSKSLTLQLDTTRSAVYIAKIELENGTISAKKIGVE